MTTFQGLVDSTRQHLMTGQGDILNILQTTINTVATAVQFTYEIKGVSPGVIIGIDLEEMYVVNVSTTTPSSSITVIRGMNGSTPATHTAGAVIRVQPQFTDWRISQFVNEALHNISADGLFRIASVDFDYNPSVQGYDLAMPGLIDIWRVRYRTPGSDKSWPVIRHEYWQLDRAADTDVDEFPSGNQLLITLGGSSGLPVRVSYRRGFDQLVNLTDDVLAVSGLHTEAHNIPPLGAAIALLGGREIKRSFLNRQPEPRRQQEVPPGSANQAMIPLIKRYEERIMAEIKRLRRQYPGAL